ncbi:MAG: DUF885 family protein [Bacteroidota bacterium]
MPSLCSCPRWSVIALAIIHFIINVPALADDAVKGAGGREELISLFREFRVLAQPTMPDGVPDYKAETMSATHRKLQALQERLALVDTANWPLEQRVDYELLRAEMNGLDFHIRVLQPWTRDPAYYALVWSYQSDTPAHEGPTSHGAIELWQYTFPLSLADAVKLGNELKLIPPFLRQARINLSGNARDLWMVGITNIRDQANDLDDLATKTANAGSEFRKILAEAKEATVSFAEWLEQQAPSKTGSSGIGKEAYTWHLRNVLLVPFSWEDEVALLKRELDRAYTMLSLERHRNRKLPPIQPASDSAEFDRRTDASVSKLMNFLKNQDILTVRSYMEPELRKHIGEFQPVEQRNFFMNVVHLEPAVLYSHSTHWFETAMMRDEPHPNPLRRDALPYNIWMSRSEGQATGVEERFMHAGLYDDNPRARELVWIMLAFRCARGLASLYAHANEITLEEARAYQIQWTPNGWVGEDLSLVGFEQHLYLRQPGYGTCYVTGKYLIERLIADRSRQLGNAFTLKNFFDEMYGVGMIPVSLIRWQMTGLDDEIKIMTKE